MERSGNMPAPQQRIVPVYKETANIPRPNTAYYLHREDRSPGVALSRLLGVIPKVAGKVGQDNEPSKAEQEQLAALAAMGAERDRLRLAKGAGVFGLMNGKEATMDSYELNRGRRDADLFAGELRDAYAKSGLSKNDDPKAFAAFAEKYRNEVFNERLKGASASYHHGYITRIGRVFEDMAKAHAGHLDSFIASQNKLAMQNRINQKVELELAVDRERGAFGNFMDSIMGAESAGNYNAFHGNGGNSTIKFTDMTIGEVLEWQASREWESYGARSSAVGKYQFIHKTLKETVRSSGIDPNTKFTPAVQDKLIFHRLLTFRKMKDYLEGKISAEEFLDKHLAKEFAGLKTTSGKGIYDGDGLNVASLSARKTVTALIAFKQAYQQDPGSLLKTDSKGKLVIDPMEAGDNPQATVAMDIETAEVEYGVPQTEARTAAADALIGVMKANPLHAERTDLEDLMAGWKLSKAERARVISARDRIKEETSTSSRVAEQRERSETAQFAAKFINGDQEALAEIKSRDVELHQRLLQLEAEPAPVIDTEGQRQVALDGLDLDDPAFMSNVVDAYADGWITKEEFRSVVEQHRMKQEARTVLEMPGVKAFVSTLEESLSPSYRETFNDQLVLVIDDLRQAHEGKRPPFREVLEEVQQLHKLIQQQAQNEQEQLMDKYKL